MADNKVIFEIVATAKGFSIVDTQQKKLAKEIDNTTKSQKKLDKQRDKGYGRQQQAMIQTANGTKNFSKLNQTIGGSGGSGALVSTYALLAANVFAATAAFSALRNAAAVEKLGEGLQAFGNQTGMSLDLVAKKLKEVTGGAVSMEQAMRTAALSTSAGFGVTEMEGLTRVAKGASLALGRDMGDALDRLTRGAIKLEPEILDELGIMVRLDDAVETYAAQLGKAASGLTRFERQQAFMNAIITEGEDKFGGIADSLKPNAYDNLSAALADLAQTFTSFLNTALIPIVNFFMSSPALFLGGILAMSGGITSRLIPSIASLTAASKMSATQARLTAQTFIEDADGKIAASRAELGPTKENAKAYNLLSEKLQAGTASSAELATAKRSLSGAIRGEIKAQDETLAQGGKVSANDAKLLKSMQNKAGALKTLAGAHVTEGAARKAKLALADENFYDAETDILTEASRETHGFADTLKMLTNTLSMSKVALTTYWMEVYEAQIATTSGSLANVVYAATLATLKTAFKAATLSVKAFGSAILRALPYLGLLMIAYDILIGILKFIGKLFGLFTEETKASNEAQKNLGVVLDGVADKMKKFEERQKAATRTTKILTDEYRLLGGIAKSAFDEALKAQEAMDKEGARNRGLEDNRNVRDAVGISQMNIGAMGEEGAQEFKDNFVEDYLKNVDAFSLSIVTLEKNSDKAAAIVKERLGSSMSEFAFNFLRGGNSIQDLAEISKATLVDVEKQLNGVAQASDGVSTALKEAEKEAGKFLRTFAVKSKYDGLITSISGVNTELNGLKEQAKEAGIEVGPLLAEALQSLGPQVSLLGGMELGKELDVSKKMFGELDVLRKAKNASYDAAERTRLTNLIKLKEKELSAQALVTAGVAKKQLPALLKKLARMREIDLMLKKEQAAIKAIAKGAKMASKDGAVSLRARALTIDVLDRESKQIKHNLHLNERTLEVARQQLAAGAEEHELEKSLQAALLQKRGGEERLLQIKKDQIRAAVTTEEMALQEVKGLQKMVALRKELGGLIAGGVEKEQKIAKFRQGDALNTAGQEAQQKFEAAKLANAFERQTAEIKFAVIDAEHALLQARVAIEKDLIAQRLGDLKAAATQSQGVGFSAVAGVGGVAEVTTPITGGGDKALFAKLESLAAKNQKQFDESGIQGLKDRADAYTDMAATVAARMTEQLTGGEIGRLNDLSSSLQNAVDIGGTSTELGRQILEKTLGNLDLDLSIAAQTFSKNLGEDLLLQAGGGSALANAFQATTTNLIGASINAAVAERIALAGDNEDGSNDKAIADLDLVIAKLESEMPTALGQAAESMQILANVSASVFGEDGILVTGLLTFSGLLVDTFDKLATSEVELGSMDALIEKMEAGAAITAGLTALSQAYGKQKITEVDQSIEAEKKRDGKSKESLAKIAALEKKKDQIAKKNFERNKALQMASIVINTATAVMKTMGDTGFFGSPLAMAVAAMGAASLALVASTQYNSTSAAGAVAEPTNLSIGGRGNEVDVAKRAGAGETAYLRGGRGSGSSANNFVPGGANGRKGYADGGVLVGERGPEVVKAEVIPNYALGGGNGANVTFNVNAVDGQSVQNMLNDQQGNIIDMIRQAANDNGEGFLESVDSSVYNGSDG